MATAVTIVGTSGNDTIRGIDPVNGVSSGVDQPRLIFGRAGDDSLTGVPEASDTFSGGLGNDTLDGADDADRGDLRDVAMYVEATGAVRVSLATGRATGAEGSDALVGIEDVWGSDFDDQLVGNDRINNLWGRDGNDTLEGGDGDDNLDGDAGHDVLLGGAGADRLAGGPGDDLLDGGPSWDTFIYSGGNDTLVGGPEAESRELLDMQRWSGPVRVDLAAGEALAAPYRLLLRGDFWTVLAGRGNDTLIGTGAADELWGGDGHDLLQAGAGDDRLLGGAGDDTLDGGDGIDRVDYSDGASGITAVLTTGVVSSAVSGVDTLIGIERLTGTGFADLLDGGPGDDSIDGNGGVDTVRGGDGRDRLVGHLVEGGAGDDTLTGVSMYGGAGDDRLGWSAAGLIDGGPGFDGLVAPSNLSGYGGTVMVDLATSRFKLVTNHGSGIAMSEGLLNLRSIEALYGSKGHTSTFIGDDHDNLLDGDTVIGAGGNDTLRGGFAEYAGTSVPLVITLDAVAGRALVRQGLETDVVDTTVLALGSGADVMQGPARTSSGDWVQAEVWGRDGNDVLIGRMVRGGPGDDTIAADTAAYDDAPGPVQASLATGIASGADGHDRLIGVVGLRGSSFSDALTGDGGSNTLYSGAGGNDSMNGGDGDDLLVIRPGALQLDGGSGVDVLRLEPTSSGQSSSWAGDQVLDLRQGTLTLNGQAGSVRGIEMIEWPGVAKGMKLVGLDGPAALRGERFLGSSPAYFLFDLRGDTIDGGAGIDIYRPFLGATRTHFEGRADAAGTVRLTNKTYSSWPVIDTLVGVERVRFDDGVLAFGERAVEVAKVAFALWSPAIVVSSSLFGKGIDWYDDGRSYDELIQLALSYYAQLDDRQFAQNLIANVATQRTLNDVLALMTGSGGGTAGRAHVTRLFADDAANLAQIDLAGLRTHGIDCALQWGAEPLFAWPGG